MKSVSTKVSKVIVPFQANFTKGKMSEDFLAILIEAFFKHLTVNLFYMVSLLGTPRFRVKKHS